jgi:hypothetical protein
MVLTVVTLLFILLSGLMAATSYGRRVTGQYGYYSGLYDLAVAANEQVLLSYWQELDRQQETLHQTVRSNILDISRIENRLVYRNGVFHFRSVSLENRLYSNLYRAEANRLWQAYLTEHWQSTANRHIKTWDKSIVLSGAEQVLQESYRVVTTLARQGPANAHAYLLETKVQKEVNGRTGHPVTVTANLEWSPDNRHQEIFVPEAFAWRGLPPVHFTYAVYTGEGPVTVTKDAVDVSLLTALRSHGLPSLSVASVHEMDVSLLYDGDVPNPSSVFINTCPLFTLDSATPAPAVRVFASDPARNHFNGLFITSGRVTVEGVQLRGGLWAEGGVTVTGSTLQPDADIIFNVPVAGAAQRDLFDFLRLTNFSQTPSPTSNMVSLLGRLTFASEGGLAQGSIVLNNFDVYTPTMVKSKRITD